MFGKCSVHFPWEIFALSQYLKRINLIFKGENNNENKNKPTENELFGNLIKVTKLTPCICLPGKTAFGDKGCKLFHCVQALVKSDVEVIVSNEIL